MRLLAFLTIITPLSSWAAAPLSCHAIFSAQREGAYTQKWQPPPLKGYLSSYLSPKYLADDPQLKLPIGNGVLGITKSKSEVERKDTVLIPYGQGNTTLIITSRIEGRLRIETLDVGERVTFPENRNDGESVFKRKIDEILDFVLPLYSERRGWSDDMVQGLKTKAFATAESTKYIVVRDKQTDMILGVIGLTKAPFGKATFKDQKSGKWVEVFGQFGQLFKRQPKFPSVPYLNSPIPILPTEVYLPELKLNRPAIVEQRYDDYYNEHDRINPFKAAESDFWNTEFRPAPSSPFYVSSGLILEPTKFAIAKNIEHHGVTRSILIKEIFSAIFDLRFVTDLSRNGTYLYTYNDEEGALLYRRMGFKVLSDKPIRKDGTNWVLLGLSPADALRLIERNKSRIDSVSEAFSRELEEQLTAIDER